MSDQETYVAELLLEDAMDEVFHGGPSTDLADRILQTANGVEEADAETVPAQEAPAETAEPVPAAPMKLLPGGFRDRPWYRWAIDGAVAACVAAVLVLLFVPNTEVEPKPPQVSVELPAGVAATDDAQYIPGVLGDAEDALQVEGGWYVLTNGAPAVMSGGHRVDDVEGTVLVKVGEIPNEEELAAQMPWLTTQNILEEDMSAKQWIKVGALAVCVMAGSAWVNDSFVMAQDSDRQDSDRKEDADRPAAKLAQLEKELEELEGKLERARGMEDGRDKRQKIARIENAIKDKKAEIANLKERIRNAEGNDRRDGERKESDRRDSDRKNSDRPEGERKNSDRRDGDRAAEEKREADRKVREEAARKEREAAERERKAREDEDRARKEREERARKERENDRKRDGRKQ